MSASSPPDLPAYLTPQGLADHLGVPVATVYRWNYEHRAPRRLKVGRHVRYMRADVLTWLTRQYATDEGGNAA